MDKYPSPVRSSPLRVAMVLGLASSLLLLFGCSKDKAAEQTPPASPSSSAASPSATPSAPTPLCLEDPEAQADQSLGQL